MNDEYGVSFVNEVYVNRRLDPIVSHVGTQWVQVHATQVVITALVYYVDWLHLVSPIPSGNCDCSSKSVQGDFFIIALATQLANSWERNLKLGISDALS